MVRIILVVDDPNSAQDTQNRLQRMSDDVTALTATADQVIARADELRPDVILLDAMVKGETNGIDVAQQIKSRHDIPIIFTTANADEATVRRAIAADLDGFLIKPLDPLELRAAIEMAIHRHSVEARARESDHRVRELTESLSEVIFETDMAGNITFVNRAGLKEFGYTKEQVEGGMTLYDLVPPDKHEEIRESIAHAVIDDPSAWREVPGLRRDGSTFPVSVRASVIVREGVPVGIRGIAFNVTDQKRAERKLEESERRIREITDALPVVVYETDATGRMTFVNATAFDLFGYTKEEVEAGMSIFQLIAPADLERARAVFRRRMRGEDLGRVEYTGLQKDGSTFPISIRSALMWQDAAVVGQRGVILDFTELKRAEEEIKERTRTTEILHRIVTEGSRTTDVQSFAEAATHLTLELMDFDAGTIHLVDDDARCANLRYVTGIPDTAVEAIRKISLDEAPYADFLVETKPLFVDGHEASRVPHVAELGLEALAMVPMYRYNTIVGALTFGSFKRHTFSQAEQELLIAIGSEVGTVIAKLQTDEALKESERRIREITDALPVVVYETDGTGRITFGNSTAFDLFGYTKEELEAGMSLFHLIAPADRRRARAVFRRSMTGEDVSRVEYTGLRKDGSTLYISIRAALMRHDGVVVGLRGIIVDITERKKAELALHRVQEELRQHATMFDAAHDAIVTLDPEGTITYWNHGAERLYGWTKHEAEGQNANALLRTRFPESREVLWPKLMESGLWEGELIHVTRDGVPVTVASSWTLMKDEKGNPSAILEISSDVTERKKAELALAESEAKLRITFETMADGIVIAELDERVTDCNEAILRLTQRSGEEILGKPFEDLQPPEFRSLIPDARKLLVRAIFARTVPSRGKKETVRTDSQLLRKNGERVDIEANISLIEDSAGQPAAFLIVARDVTERKQMECQLDSTLADLKRSNAELEQFAYVTSHDLQEPLRMITSYIQIIEEDYKGKLDTDADQYIAFAVEGAKRMHTLINDLLAYSRVGTRGEPFMPTSMSSVLSAAIANLDVAIEESHAVVTHDQLPTVLGDESQLIQLLQNLLGNAIKFRSDDTPMIHVGVEETNNDWVFSVRDNGIGIDMKYAERIFAVFQRLHAREDYPGTGIGLAVVRKIVERHGGRIWVESEPAKGATFYFTLPREDSLV